MEQKLSCHFVQDLLPNYIEGLTSDYTNKAVQEHLSTCSECRKALDSMTKETQAMKVVPPKQINFLKKIKRRQWRIAGISVAASVMILLGAYYFFSYRDFPIPSSDVTISDVYQMNDGSIHYRISAKVNGYVGRVTNYSNGISETARVYERRRLGSNPSKTIVSEHEKWSSLHDSNSSKEKTGIYYEGKDKNDRITIWEKGAAIPKATAEQEANYKNKIEKKEK
ncbi:zf-HC2 domain-containing protein [Paenibacillus sp. MBLB4367]|uniref:zf-HC2 domain-containing protein n=1 Tax=Paenibacillus sp. MBLB4367 TaxID=3384767 RepID=UPI003907FCB8